MTPHSETRSPAATANAIAAGIAIVIPPAIFYLLLSRSLTWLPFFDDYQAVIQYALDWQHAHGLGRVVQILMYQHNEYRLMLNNFVVSVQLALLGHLNLLALCVLGDLFVIPVFIALWLIWRDFGHPGNTGLWLLVPASWLLFQLQYASTLNYAMDAMQMVPVILFMLLSCWLLARPGNAEFAGAVAAVILSIASSANGLFMIPIGALLLLQQRQFRRLAVWIAAGALMSGIYFYHYDFHARQGPASHSVLSSVSHISLPYAGAFLGSIATVTRPLPAILFSLVLLGIFLMATRDRLYRRNPALYYAALFFFVTAIALSGLRSDLGLAEALGSRYRLNSTVLVILLYFYLADKALHLRIARNPRIAATAVAGVLIVLFTAESDHGGQKLLLMRRERLREAMLHWERHEPPPPVVALGPDDFTLQHLEEGMYEPDPGILQQALSAHLYQLQEPLDQR